MIHSILIIYSFIVSRPVVGRLLLTGLQQPRGPGPGPALTARCACGGGTELTVSFVSQHLLSRQQRLGLVFGTRIKVLLPPGIRGGTVRVQYNPEGVCVCVWTSSEQLHTGAPRSAPLLRLQVPQLRCHWWTWSHVTAASPPVTCLERRADGVFLNGGSDFLCLSVVL